MLPWNCLFGILYVRFSAPQITAVSQKGTGIICVYRNELLYVDNPKDGCKLVLPKQWQPLANINDIISGKPVISSAPLWEYQSCTSNYKIYCISVISINFVLCITTHPFPHFLRFVPCHRAYTRSVEICTGPDLAFIPPADTTLPWTSMIWLLNCWNDTNPTLLQAFLACSCFNHVTKKLFVTTFIMCS